MAIHNGMDSIIPFTRQTAISVTALLSLNSVAKSLANAHPKSPSFVKGSRFQRKNAKVSKPSTFNFRMPKCFSIPLNTIANTLQVVPRPNWHWKTFGYGEYYGAPVYLKQIPRPTADDKQVQTFQSIAALLTDLHHPKVVQFLGVIAAPHYPTWSIITERLEHGDLATLLKTATTLSVAKCIQILLDVACAMSYMHGQSPPILHRDLRAANIQITDDFRAKITNFELAGQLGLNKALVGTPAWVAPEIMHRDTNYTEKIDIYSFAMLMVEIMNRQTPYADETLPKAELLRQVADEDKRPNVKNREMWPRKLVDLMEQCWSKDASVRPSFGTIIKELQDIQEALR